MLAPRPPAPRRDPAPPAVPGAVGAVLGLPLGAVAALGAWVFGGGAATGLTLALAAAVWLGTATSVLGGVVAAAQTWACYDGFVLHRFGTLQGGRADLVALGVIAAAALVTGGVIRAVRHTRTSVALRGYPAVRFPDAVRATSQVG